MKNDFSLIRKHDENWEDMDGVLWSQRGYEFDNDDHEYEWEDGLREMLAMAAQKEAEARELRERVRLMSGIGETEAQRLLDCANLIARAERNFKSTRDYLDGKQVGSYYVEVAQMGLEHWDNEARKARGLLSEADKMIAKFMGWL